MTWATTWSVGHMLINRTSTKYIRLVWEKIQYVDNKEQDNILLFTQYNNCTYEKRRYLLILVKIHALYVVHIILQK